MPVNRPVSREMEEVEFKPIPGTEDSWPQFSYIQRSRLWAYLGIYPVGMYISVWLVLLGVSL